MKGADVISLLRRGVLFLFVFLLPTQLGRYFFFDFSYVYGVRIDFLAPALFLSDLVSIGLIVLYLFDVLRFVWQWRVRLVMGVVMMSWVISLYWSADTAILGVGSLLTIVQWLGIVAAVRAAWWRDHAATTTLLLAGFFSGIMIQLVLTIWQLQIRGSVQGVFYWLGERFMIFTTPDIARARLFGEPFIRPYGTFSHPNSLGGFYALVHAFVLTWQPFHRLPYLRALVLAGSAMLVVLSFSKGAAGALAIVYGVLVMGPMLLRHWRARCWICLSAKILLIGGITTMLAMVEGDPDSIDKRIWLIEQASVVVAEHPLFGVGPGNSLIAQSTIDDPFAGVFVQPVHNIVLLAISEIGLVGFGLLLAVLVRPLVCLFSDPMVRRGLFACLTIVLVTGMVDHYWLTLQQNILVSAVVFGAVVRYNRDSACPVV